MSLKNTFIFTVSAIGITGLSACGTIDKQASKYEKPTVTARGDLGLGVVDSIVNTVEKHVINEPNIGFTYRGALGSGKVEARTKRKDPVNIGSTRYEYNYNSSNSYSGQDSSSSYVLQPLGQPITEKQYLERSRRCSNLDGGIPQFIESVGTVCVIR